MAKQVIDAVFEHGAFRPSSPIAPPIPEGQHVRLVVEVTPPAADPLEELTRILDTLSEDEVAAIEAIALERRPFFGGRGGA